ncbi:MAG: tetratricopeptide repeat protein [Gemmataceae bacterium]|nr:tetratricopeptide repeat protein [Gemmataceae bacterium]
MALDPYSACPCGSGKKFKWCCQPIHVEIDKAFQQDQAGQHEVALRTMEEVVAAHDSNPEAWGRKAELLYRGGKVEEAEAALDRAFQINPAYPFGFLLRGMFRQQEGEIGGALLLFRKAAEAYDPAATDQLSHIYAMIGEGELKQNRPVATRAALHMSLRLQPNNDELRQALDGFFGNESRLPLSARREYLFLSPANLQPERRAAWDAALERAATGRLTDAIKAFTELTRQDESNAAAWYNLALARAWLGDNPAALEALDRYVALETDEELAANAWSLAEALRLGHGMEAQTDYVEYSVFYQVREPRAISALLKDWQDQRRMVVLQAREDQPVLQFVVLERPPSLMTDPASAPPPSLAANVLIVGDRVRVWHTNREAFDRVREEIQQKAGAAMTASSNVEEVPANFSDVLANAVVFPIDAPDKETGEKIVRQHFERFFEDKWIHQPLRSLGGVPPVDAAGHGTLRKKLRGVVQFLEEAAVGQPYDFGRLRRKLGLSTGAEAPAAASAAAKRDIRGMGASELATLPTEGIEDDDLDEAFQTALRLDARELAGKFAKALVALPAGKKPDRYPWYIHLVNAAMTEGNTDAALNFLSLGEQSDASQNEGRRQNDYALRRGQVHAKRGEADVAQEVFDRLIERAPTELRYRGTATEAMLSARQGAKALKFAEAGLAKARELQNRDSEHYFLELATAARKQS